MIYITGDTHIPVDIHKLSTKQFSKQKEMTKEDYIIICGDFGGVWDNSNEEKYWIKWLKNKNFTTLFIDGNHENYEILYNLPTVKFAGGTVHKVDEGIYHLMRGEIYKIDKKTFFVFGGASSHDRKKRKEGIDWWKEELPNEMEYENAKRKLEKNDYKVDYILTHSAPSSIQKMIAPKYEINELTNFLEDLKNSVSYKKWFFGHYHLDRKYCEDAFVGIFNGLYEI